MTIRADSATAAEQTTTGERQDLLASLATHRHFLRHTVRDLTDEQAGLHPTVSELCLGGIIKHVTAVESYWTSFIVNGPSEIVINEETMARWAAEFEFGLALILDGLERALDQT